jgi:hypothetical protein
MLAVLSEAKIAQLAAGRDSNTLLKIARVADSNKQESFSSQFVSSEIKVSTTRPRSAPKSAARSRRQI